MTIGFSDVDFDIAKGLNKVSNPWVIKDLSILSNTDKEAGVYSIDVSEYLPDDNNQYEVLWQFSGTGNATLQLNGTNFGGILSSNTASRANGIMPVDSARTLTYQVYSGGLTGGTILFRAYRKTTNF